MSNKNRIFYFLTLILVGFLGYYLSFYNSIQSRSVIEKRVVPPNLVTRKPIAINNISKVKATEAIQKIYQKLHKENYDLPEYLPNKAVLSNFIDNIPSHEIDNYFNKWITQDDFDFGPIRDKRTLAKSLMREFLNEPDNLHNYMNANLSFSRSEKIDEVNSTHFNLANSQATIYAHLQLDEFTEFMSDVFVKWTHNDQILLFEKKKINSQTYNNWVSWTPDENWQVGHYQVIFYQFNALLTPIIQASYDVY